MASRGRAEPLARSPPQDPKARRHPAESARKPCTLAASRTFSIRPRTRDAVSGIFCQIGLRTLSTSAVVISSTALLRSGMAYSRSVISHCARCFALRQLEPMDSMCRSASSPNVSLRSAACLDVRGSFPSARSARASSALFRAKAIGTAAVPPRPISQRLPSDGRR